MFDVMETRCDQCLFDPENRIVSVDRMRDVLAECRERDCHFVCHKSTIVDGRHGNVCCRGFYDANPEASNLMRIAGRLNAVRFVPVPVI